MNWKIATPIAVMVLAVVVVLGTKGNSPEKLAVNEEVPVSAMSADARMAKSESLTMAVMSEEPVSGNIDDLLVSLETEADLDMDQFADASGDIALLSADTQSINDIGTAYDETTF